MRPKLYLDARWNTVDVLLPLEQVQIRRLPKPVIAMVAGYAVGGGQILQMMCDITVSSIWRPLVLCILAVFHLEMGNASDISVCCA